MHERVNKRHLQRMPAAGPAGCAAVWPDYRRTDNSRLAVFPDKNTTVRMKRTHTHTHTHTHTRTGAANKTINR